MLFINILFIGFGRSEREDAGGHSGAAGALWPRFLRRMFGAAAPGDLGTNLVPGSAPARSSAVRVVTPSAVWWGLVLSVGGFCSLSCSCVVFVFLCCIRVTRAPPALVSCSS